MHVIELWVDGEWVAWTSTANKSRVPMLLALAKVVHRTKKVRVRP